jgi:type VI secretion system protein ImpJ
VRKLAIDLDALKADTLRVTELSLIFPEGEIVRAPQQYGCKAPAVWFRRASW